MKAYRYERERRRLRREIHGRRKDAIVFAGTHELVTTPEGYVRLRNRETGELMKRVTGLQAWLPIIYPQSAIDDALSKSNPFLPFFGLDRFVASRFG